MKQKKTLILFLAFVALAGIINCAVVESAFAYQDDKAMCQTDNQSHCCFICNAAFHQWMSDSGGVPFPIPSVETDFVLKESSFYFGSFSSSIFHPPQSL